MSKITQNIKMYDANYGDGGVFLETLYDDDILLRVASKEFNFSTKVSKKLLLDFLKHLEK